MFQSMKKCSEGYKKLKSNASIDTDHRNIFENLCKVIVDERMKLDSLEFKQICTIVRSQETSQEKLKNVKKEKKSVALKFPDREIRVGQSEINAYDQVKNDPMLIRLLTGNGE